MRGSFRFLAVALVTLVAGIGPARAAEPVPAALAPVAFLIGEWQGAGRADVGPGSGTDSFRLDLGGHAIVRRSRSTYPGGAGVPASTYESLMVVYPSSDSGAIRADYFDNGGHVIHYALVAGTAPNVAQFLSDGPTAQPTFRLTYAAHGDASLEVTFEMAPPGSAAFSTIAHGVDRRSP